MGHGLKEISKHMREFGLNLLGRAIYDVTFSEHCRPFAHSLAITHAAHGAEIVIKARIAQEHPLLIFSRLPEAKTKYERLSLQALFDDSVSYSYRELPDILWATAGYRMKNRDRYLRFGKMRNTIQHFAVPNEPFDKETLRFCIEVVEPMLNDFWAESAIPYAEEWDETIVVDGYLQELIQEHEIAVPLHLQEKLAK